MTHATFDVLDPPQSQPEPRRRARRDDHVKIAPAELRRVLCALDMERWGSASLGMASLLGECFDASVDVLYAPPPCSIGESRTEAVTQLATEHAAQERLSAIVASVTGKVSVSPYVTPGPASAVILTHSMRHASDLIVMASPPYRRVVASGDTIAPVSERAACAVLTVGDRFQPAALRRILLPVGPAGVQEGACRWVTTLASRFDAEVGFVRIDQPRSGLWKAVTTVLEPSPANSRHLDCGKALALLCRAGIDAYEIAHPGGSDADALARLCETGAFDALVMGLPVAAECGTADDRLLAAVRRKTSLPVLSVRSLPSPVSFASSHFEPTRRAAVGTDCAQL